MCSRTSVTCCISEKSVSFSVSAVFLLYSLRFLWSRRPRGLDQRWFCFRSSHFSLTRLRAAAGCQRRSAERNKHLHFLFRKQLWWNLLDPVVLESKCKSGTVSAAAGRWWRRQKDVWSGEIKEWPAPQLSGAEPTHPGSWWWWGRSKNTFLVHVWLHRCYMTNTQNT